MTITQSQYHQLVGLLTLAAKHVSTLREIEQALLDITQEKDRDGTPNDLGHTMDAVYCGDTAEELMRKVGLTVEASV